MKLKQLFEAPQQIGPTEFGLDNIETNKKFGNYLLHGIKTRYMTKTPLYKIDEATLWELKKQYALIRDSDNYVSYYMKFQFNHIKAIDRLCVSQVIVWRSQGYYPDPSISKKIFNDLIFKYKTVITDSMQMGNGRGFWQLRIAEALAASMHVYYLNYSNSNYELIEISTHSDYFDVLNAKQPYGPTGDYQRKRFIITTEQFDNSVKFKDVKTVDK